MNLVIACTHDVVSLNASPYYLHFRFALAARVHAREGGMPEDADVMMLNTRVAQELHEDPPTEARTSMMLLLSTYEAPISFR